MTRPPLVPPLKCQGIKTKLVGEINRIEPFRFSSHQCRAFTLQPVQRQHEMSFRKSPFRRYEIDTGAFARDSLLPG